MNRPKTNANRRHGHCYELADDVLFKMDDPGNWRLVHGIVNGPKGVGRMDHAWVTDGAEVFDAVLNRVYTVKAYKHIHKAKVVAIYDRKQMRDMTDTYNGRWKGLTGTRSCFPVDRS